jgi:ligand-binding sensor domain-containing protein
MPPTINDAYADLPQLRAGAGHILTGPLMDQGVFTAAAPNPSGSGWYLGTSNRGLLFFDRVMVEPQPMLLGLPGDLVGALAAASDGVWVINNRSLRTPSAITFLSGDLATSSPIRGPAAFGLPFEMARQVVPGDRALWLATEKGLVRASLDDGRITRWVEGDGLPDGRVTAVAQFRGSVVAGTMRGLVEVGNDDRLSRRARSFDGAIYALKANGDTLWVGTAYGLYASLAGDDSLRMPEGFRRIGAIPPVLGVGYVADTLVAMTPDHLVWRNPATGEWNRGPDLGGILGQLTAFVATSDGAWLGGTRGAGLARPTTSVLRPLMVGNELPAEVTSIVVNGTYLWVGTMAGLVRIRLVGQ